MAVYTTIDDPSAYFHIQLFTGDDNADRLITNDANAGDFRPDLLILKNRSSVSSHGTFDSSRLASSESTLILRTNGSGAEEDKVDRFGGFETDGFTVDGNDADTNADGDLFVAWQWKANGSGGAQTDGDIDTVRSTNTTSLFTVATYTASGTAGNTLGHGLGVVPGLYIIKNRDEADNWRVYHHKNTSAPETEFLGLNVTNATEDDAGMTNDTAPTTSLITLGSMVELNTSGEDYVMYAWGEVQGFSKFGSYTGNANADGPFIYTGFKPALVCVKLTSASGEAWNVVDNKRAGGGGAGGNPNGNILLWSGNDADYASGSYQYAYVDMLSNGFKIRTSANQMNKSGQTFVFMAWAEAPFVNSNGVPCNAR